MVSIHTAGIMLAIFAFVLLSGVSLSSTAQGNDELPTILEQADIYSQHEFDHAKTLVHLQIAAATFPGSAEILWRLSRVMADSAQVFSADPEDKAPEKLELYQQALTYADRAVAADPENSMAHTRRAIAMGQIALYKGIWDSIDLVKQTRETVEKAIELDPGNSIAHYVYARTHAAVSDRPRLFRLPLGLGWANLDKAIEHYDTALALYPEFIMIRLDAARAYVRKKENRRAHELLEPIATLPTLNQLDDHYRAQAHDLMQSIK